MGGMQMSMPAALPAMSDAMMASEQQHQTMMPEPTEAELQSAAHRKAFMEELMGIEEKFRKIPTFEKYRKMLTALKLKSDIDNGQVSIDSKCLGKHLDNMQIEKSRFYDWNKRFVYVTWGKTGQAMVARSDNMENFEDLRRFVHADELFHLIEKLHQTSGKKKSGDKHAGIKKTYNALADRYCNITRSACEIFCALCPVCNDGGRKERKRRVYAPTAASTGPPKPRAPRKDIGVKRAPRLPKDAKQMMPQQQMTPQMGMLQQQQQQQPAKKRRIGDESSIAAGLVDTAQLAVQMANP